LGFWEESQNNQHRARGGKAERTAMRSSNIVTNDEHLHTRKREARISADREKKKKKKKKDCEALGVVT
jgi:hypothetical protein